MFIGITKLPLASFGGYTGLNPGSTRLLTKLGLIELILLIVFISGLPPFCRLFNISAFVGVLFTSINLRFPSYEY